MMERDNRELHFPRWWRLLVIGGATLVLCSCRSISREASPVPTATMPVASSMPVTSFSHLSLSDGGPQMPAAPATAAPNRTAQTAHIALASAEEEVPQVPADTALESNPVHATKVPGTIVGGDLRLEVTPSTPRVPISLPAEAWTGHPGAPAVWGEIPPMIGPWVPPGIREPWPRDEYIIDGGDREQQVEVSRDRTVRGLDQEDTVIHYDTVKGETVVQPSNCVPIYAPRFAAVRKIYGIALHEQNLQSIDVARPEGIVLSQDRNGPDTVLQPLGPEAHRATDKLVGYRERNLNLGVDNVQSLQRFERELLPFEDLAFVREGFVLNSEKARLAEGMNAALTWESEEALQVIIEGVTAVELTQAQETQEVRVYEMAPGKARVRICKLASQLAAKPGEEVHFNIRFDNVGDQVVDKIAILDNLNTRLEYVEGSEQSSLQADFAAVENEGGSLILRWDLREPLKVGEGGMIRFTCRVR